MQERVGYWKHFVWIDFRYARKGEDRNREDCDAETVKAVGRDKSVTHEPILAFQKLAVLAAV